MVVVVMRIQQCIFLFSEYEYDEEREGGVGGRCCADRLGVEMEKVPMAGSDRIGRGDEA